MLATTTSPIHAGRGHAIVRAAATALNYLDVVQRNGWHQRRPGSRCRTSPAWILHGTVVAGRQDVHGV